MTVATELRALKGTRELLTAEEVVRWAQNHPKSALYKAPQFCGWSKTKAAYQHWLWGARALIAIHITYENGGRQFVSLSLDRTRPGGGYRDVDEVLRDRSLTEIMLDDALRELDRVQEKYDQLKELAAVWREKDKVKGRHIKGRKGKRRGDEDHVSV
jgi:hypothetical protein